MQKVNELSQAIAALEAQRAVLGNSVVDSALAPLRERLANLEQRQTASRQRRLVTVLFLDIVNSTLLSQGLEPEEVQEVMGGSLKRLSVPIETYGGQVTQFVGDGFVAVFGLNRVHENDARQAVRAGLAILAESRACAEELDRRFQIQGFNIRIGVNTGRVVAGRFSEAESPVMGLTVSLAARMEQAALPGTLFISQFTHQHVRGAFEVESLTPIEAKGFPQPVALYRVRAALPRTFRTFTRGVEGIKTSLIGRDTELRQLQAVLTRAVQSRETHLVTVVGEAGVGKSRLLYEFDRWVAKATSQVTAFKARASPQTTTVPFGLLRDMISYRLGILTTDPVQPTRERLVEALSTFLEDEPEMKAHFVGSLLGFDFSESPYLQGVENDPRQLRERAQLYLTQYIAAVSRKSTTILMLDDIHWADAPSLSFVTRLVRECPQLPLVVVCLARPILTDRFPGWDQEEPPDEQSLPNPPPHPGGLQLALSPLSRQASRDLLGEILRNVEGFPDALCEQILDSADGNPFYLEEYIQTLVDSRAIRRSQRGGPWRLDPERSGSRLEMPATLTALLEARLDSLNTAQRVLVQQAAVIGRVFWRSALQAVRGDKPITDAELKLLSRHGFFYPQETSTFAGTEEYRFHHGLLRDAAYQALLKSDRQVYHAQAAAWLTGVTRTSGRAGEFAPVIAEHCELAGERVLAAEWYTQSGTRARNQGDPAQARLFFDRALALLHSDVSPSQAGPDLARRWQALAGRDEVLGILGDTEARLADDVALVELAESIGDDHLVAEAYYRKGYYQGMIGQYTKEREAYTLGLAAAARAGDRRREALILGLKVLCEVRLGDLQAAAQTTTAALTCAEEVGDEEVLARTLTNVSTFHTETGDLARAAQLLDRQLAINRRTGNIEGEVAGLTNLGYTYILLGMPEEGIPALQRSINLARAIGHRSFCAYGSLNLALAHLRCGDPPSALAELDQCLPELQAMNDVFGCAVGQVYAALAREQGGQVADALAGFEQAAAALSGIGAPGSTHDAKAGAARCLLALNDLDTARQYAVLLWDYLQQKAGVGMEFPLLGYETCADVFSAAGQAALAHIVVEGGYRELMTRASQISLPEWRRSFLEQVPEHCRIQTRWQVNTETSDE
jgi:class 3 adenylate cyclase/tetratricopeptide (TPR) repeat protein